jgi:hypothetical protein
MHAATHSAGAALVDNLEHVIEVLQTCNRRVRMREYERAQARRTESEMFSPNLPMMVLSSSFEILPLYG